jgi:hypothetical protein
VTYAERNVLQEEATTVEAETITVDRFRQRFGGHADQNNHHELRSQKMAESTKMVEDLMVPKYKAPPPPPRQRRTSSSSTIIKVSPTKAVSCDISVKSSTPTVCIGTWLDRGANEQLLESTT